MDKNRRFSLAMGSYALLFALSFAATKPGMVRSALWIFLLGLVAKTFIAWRKPEE